MDRLRRDETGAMAVLLAILLLFIGIPLAAGAVSSYVRSGTVGELQRASDAGALAGARAIPLSDLSPVLPEPSFPLQLACERALAALEADDALGEDYAEEATCDAEYVPDPEIVGALFECATNVVPATPDIGLPPEFAILETTHAELLARTEEKLELLARTIRNTLPVLFVPGVTVRLDRTAAGPIDELITDGEPTAESGEGTARRRIKNIAVVPVVVESYEVDEATLELTATIEADPNEALPSAEQMIAAIAALDTTLQGSPVFGPVYRDQLGCDGVFEALADDIRDVYNPGVGDRPTTQEVLEEARQQGAAVLAWTEGQDPGLPEEIIEPSPSPTPCVPLPLVPCPEPTLLDPVLEDLADQLTAALQIPFFDFVPICVDTTSPLTVDFVTCATTAGGAFRASLVPRL